MDESAGLHCYPVLEQRCSDEYRRRFGYPLPGPLPRERENHKKGIPMNTLRLAALFSALAVASAAAQTPGPTRVRGTITGVDGNTVSVKSREGQDLKIELAPNATFAYMKSVNLAEVKAGTPLGTTVVNISGRLIARELHLFNPGRPIPNEGTRPADLEPDSLMTNATVAAVRARVSAVQSPANAEIELVLTYKGGEQHVIIP